MILDRNPHCRALLMASCASVCLNLVSPIVAPTQDDAFEPFRKDLPSLLQESFVRRLDSRKDSTEVLNLLRPVAEKARESIATVFVDGHPASLATIVSSDGLAITKASELLPGKLKVRLTDRRLLEAKVIAMRKAEDLALIQFDAQKLTPIQLVPHVPPVGSFLVSAGANGEVLGLGVAGAEVRAVAENGVLGVGYGADSGEGVHVTGVLPGSGAAAAGLEIGDEILSINNTKLLDGKMLQREIKNLYPGDRVTAIIKRGKDKKSVEIEVRDLSIAHESESDARVHGARSGRLAGFNGVLQHDTVLDPDQCGGPVLDLSGQVVGINIARAGRVCTYLYPTEKLEPLIQSLLRSVQK